MFRGKETKDDPFYGNIAKNYSLFHYRLQRTVNPPARDVHKVSYCM